ncbi:HIT-like domain-containing protein [Paraphoma chrysanthemicola]|nr:HIT-like domain-containing protein [Paraphoma chrysanthemicola]
MSSAKKKPKPEPTAEDVQPTSTLEKAKNVVKGWDPRHGLGIYIDKPETNPEGRIVEYDDDFVVIRDKFPKASVHLLLIPRSPEIYTEHPLHLLSTDPTFLATIRTRVARLKSLAAADLRRQFGHLSASDAPYQAALEDLMSNTANPTPAQLSSLPAGRDWESDIIAGVHTHPSMNHLHVHVLSRDMHSACLQHKKHYLSFTSSFFVRIDEFPLEEGSARFKPGKWPNWDMRCWRCGEDYGNKFARLKEHLEKEFEAWKRE